MFELGPTDGGLCCCLVVPLATFWHSMRYVCGGVHCFVDMSLLLALKLLLLLELELEPALAFLLH
jgi:hypothetical protein